MLRLMSLPLSSLLGLWAKLPAQPAALLQCSRHGGDAAAHAAKVSSCLV